MATLTWLGHAAFRIDTDDGKRIYVDPFLQNNPKTPDGEKEPDRVDIIAVTHGHSDHAGEVPALSKRFPDAEVVAQVELKGWLGKQGANVGELPGLNKGGTQEIDGIRFTLVNAFHSSSSDEGDYLEEPEDAVGGLQALLWALALALLVVSCAARSPETQTHALPPLGASALAGCLAVLAIKVCVALAPLVRRAAFAAAKP